VRQATSNLDSWTNNTKSRRPPKLWREPWLKRLELPSTILPRPSDRYESRIAFKLKLFQKLSEDPKVKEGVASLEAFGSQAGQTIQQVVEVAIAQTKQ
jgi:hypothetical protein